MLAGRHTRRKTEIKMYRPETLPAIRSSQGWSVWHPSPGTAGAIVPKPRGSSTKNVSSPGLVEFTTSTIARWGMLEVVDFCRTALLLASTFDAASVSHVHRKRVQRSAEIGSSVLLVDVVLHRDFVRASSVLSRLVLSPVRGLR